MRNSNVILTKKDDIKDATNDFELASDKDDAIILLPIMDDDSDVCRIVKIRNEKFLNHMYTNFKEIIGDFIESISDTNLNEMFNKFIDFNDKKNLNLNYRVIFGNKVYTSDLLYTEFRDDVSFMEVNLNFLSDLETYNIYYHLVTIYDKFNTPVFVLFKPDDNKLYYLTRKQFYNTLIKNKEQYRFEAFRIYGQALRPESKSFISYFDINKEDDNLETILSKVKQREVKIQSITFKQCEKIFDK